MTFNGTWAIKFLNKFFLGFYSPLPPPPQGDWVHQFVGTHPLQRRLLAAVLFDHHHPAGPARGGGGPGAGAELRAQPGGPGAGPEPARHPASVHPGAAEGGQQRGPRCGPEDRQPDERDQRCQGRVHAVNAGWQVGHNKSIESIMQINSSNIVLLIEYLLLYRLELKQLDSLETILQKRRVKSTEEKVTL